MIAQAPALYGEGLTTMGAKGHRARAEDRLTGKGGKGGGYSAADQAAGMLLSV